MSCVRISTGLNSTRSESGTARSPYCDLNVTNEHGGAPCNAFVAIPSWIVSPLMVNVSDLHRTACCTARMHRLITDLEHADSMSVVGIIAWQRFGAQGYMSSVESLSTASKHSQLLLPAMPW
eukprot:3107450-Rhodomonas_salina.5